MALRVVLTDDAARDLEEVFDLTDKELYDLAKASHEESFPVEVVQALVDGEHPIAVFCRHRGLRQRHVAEKVGIHPTYLLARGSPCEGHPRAPGLRALLSQIVRGRRQGSTKTLAAIARILNVELDDLILYEGDHST